MPKCLLSCYFVAKIKNGVIIVRFSDKLDFLMNVSNTSNSALALCIRMDPSHISRLRRGERNAIKDAAVIKSMGLCFARHLTQEYQRKALIDALNLISLPSDEKKVADLISNWLLSPSYGSSQSVESFLSGLSSYSRPKNQTSTGFNSNSTERPQAGMSVYYGIEGKRKAAEYFLTEVIEHDKPQTLLLFSDEPTDWMTFDRAFAMKWAQLMLQVLAKGNRIKIIHTVSRDIDEMFNAISQWMPLYMSGLIEPYYCPKKRDGIFKQTLFISPDVTAVVSMSVGAGAAQAANILIRDPDTIRAYTAEFMEYLGMCKTLMNIYMPKDEAEYFSNLLEFEKEDADSIIKTESLSLMTMPEALTLNILKRIVRNDGFTDLHKKRTAMFERCLKNNTFTEIIRMFDSETVKNEKVKVAFSDMLIGGSTYYTAEEYIKHLEHILELLKTRENFHVFLTEEELESRYMVYTRENSGTIVAKTSAPAVILGIKESNLSTAFWDYLTHLIGDEKYRNPNDEESVKKLEAYINRLKEAI